MVVVYMIYMVFMVVVYFEWVRKDVSKLSKLRLEVFLGLTFQVNRIVWGVRAFLRTVINYSYPVNTARCSSVQCSVCSVQYAVCSV